MSAAAGDTDYETAHPESRSYCDARLDIPLAEAPSEPISAYVLRELILTLWGFRRMLSEAVTPRDDWRSQSFRTARDDNGRRSVQQTPGAASLRMTRSKRLSEGGPKQTGAALAAPH